MFVGNILCEVPRRVCSIGIQSALYHLMPIHVKRTMKDALETLIGLRLVHIESNGIFGRDMGLSGKPGSKPPLDLFITLSCPVTFFGN